MFASDLRFGHKYENIFINDYLKNPDDIIRPSGFFSPYDMMVSGKTYEVKSDRMAYKTGNMVIEASCNGKASGIATTEADFWAYFVVISEEEYDLYLIPTKYIKDLIEIKHFNLTKGGDDGRAEMYLLSIKTFFKSFKI